MRSSSSTDLPADPEAIASRAAAIADLPRPLQADLDDPSVLRQRQDGLDDTMITLIRVETQDDYVYVQRVVWCFDEGVLRWRVDSNDLWELPEPLARTLATSLAAPRH